MTDLTSSPAAGFAARTWPRSPATWHYVSLGVGLVVILILQSGQWFFFDEWDFLKLNGPGLFTPHVGHWSTSPMLVFRLLRAVFGLHSYYPFAVAITLVHLAAAHMLWRVCVRSGANAWIATTLVAVFIFFGTGAENILWGFQIGFVGAFLIGLVAFYLASGPRMTARRLAIIIAISVFSLTWSGTALPVIVATFLILLRSFGRARSLLYVAVCASVYLTWYALFALHDPGNPPNGGLGLHKLVISVPEFLGTMLLIGFGQITPLFGLAAALLIAAVVWALRSWITTRSLALVFPAAALAVGAVVFALLTAYSRAIFGLAAAASSRYVYALFLLVLPLLAVALTRLVRKRTWLVTAASVLLVALAVYQGSVLVGAAAAQSRVELHSAGLVSAAISLYRAHDPKIELSKQPDPKNAPDMSMRDVIALYRGGYLSEGSYSPAELATVARNVDGR